MAEFPSTFAFCSLCSVMSNSAKTPGVDSINRALAEFGTIDSATPSALASPTKKSTAFGKTILPKSQNPVRTPLILRSDSAVTPLDAAFVHMFPSTSPELDCKLQSNSR